MTAKPPKNQLLRAVGVLMAPVLAVLVVLMAAGATSGTSPRCTA